MNLEVNQTTARPRRGQSVAVGIPDTKNEGLHTQEAEKVSLLVLDCPNTSPCVRQKSVQHPVPPKGLSIKRDALLLAVLTLLAGLLRSYKIWHPDQVVFDEVHFGKFAAYYIRREYFFDVHPPFAK